MKVMATQVGFDGLCLRHPGDEFEIKGDLNEAGEVIGFVSENWMKRVEPQEKDRAPEVA